MRLLSQPTKSSMVQSDRLKSDFLTNSFLKSDVVPSEQATQVAIALGGNLGNSKRILADAIQAIDSTAHITVLAQSHFYKTAPIGPPQPDYINACILARTTLTAEALLTALLSIEHQFGRVRQERWGARSLDLDLLFYGDRIIDLPCLTVPHPRLHERAFVLVPLADISPEWPHPQLGKTTAQLLNQLSASQPLQSVEQISFTQSTQSIPT